MHGKAISRALYCIILCNSGWCFELFGHCIPPDPFSAIQENELSLFSLHTDNCLLATAWCKVVFHLSSIALRSCTWLIKNSLLNCVKWIIFDSQIMFIVFLPFVSLCTASSQASTNSLMITIEIYVCLSHYRSYWVISVRKEL